MKVIRIIRKIKSINLHIEELRKFIGQDTEIIIFPVPKRKLSKKKILFNLAGSIKSGSDPLDFQSKIRSEWDKRL